MGGNAIMKDNLKFMFKTNHVVLKRLLDDIGEKETLDFPENWTELFEYGSSAPDENTDFPPFAEIREKLYELQAKTDGLLEVFDENKFTEEVELTEDWRMNRLDALFFFGKHDSYHAGQITILRKSLGLQ
jgi:uncharacterized damage-inducible protein DinB